MSEDLVTVARGLTMQEAEIARGFLSSNGFDAILNGGAMFANHLTPLSGGINLMVSREDAESVRQLLADVHSQSGKVE